MSRTVATIAAMLWLISISAMAETPFSGETWRFIQVGTFNITEDIGSKIIFDNSDRISGNSGCNNFYGSYRIDGFMLSFKNIVWTKMLCDQPQMGIENTMKSVFVNTNSFKIAGKELQFLGADGTSLARLEKLSPK